LKNCPKSPIIWQKYAEFEEQHSTASKARSILETAKLKIPKSPDLWLASVRFEFRQNSTNKNGGTDRSLSMALQQCPDSGKLWAFSVDFETKAKRRGRCYDALKALPEDCYVYLSAAKLFWSERKLEKAKNWFERAVKTKDFGDAWIYYYSFSLQHGTEEEQQNLLERCSEAEPKHGEKWTSVSKKPGNMKKSTADILKEAALKIKI
ncbi:Pre-mRNA-processing factor 6, partial [Bonamia ostreae]